MLQIDLLPSYVAQRRLNKKLIAVYITGFAVVVAAGLALEFVVFKPQDANETTLANAAVAAKTYIDSETALAASTIATVAPIQANIQFFHNVQTYNATYPDLYETVARFTSPKVLYTGMAVSGATLTINAYTPSIEELGRYLQVMYHEPDLNSVSISAIPTPDQAAQKIYMYKGKVIGISGGGTLTSGGKTASIPGVPAGVNVTLPAGVKLPGGPVTGNTRGGALPPMMPNAPMGAPGGFGQPNFGAQGPGGNSATTGAYAVMLSDPDFNPKYYRVLVRKTDGFTFTATCSLKKTFAPPAVPTAGGGGATGAPGGPMGAPGGNGGPG